MRERPIIDLVDGLKQVRLYNTPFRTLKLPLFTIATISQLGVDISCSDTGCPPVIIKANGIDGGQAEISGQISSQFLSALLMTSPLARGKITIKIKDELMSAPYVHMTMNLMKKFGVTVKSENDMSFEVNPGTYKSPGTYFIEGELSSCLPNFNE